MKISKLVKYLNETGFKHIKNKNLPVSLKHKIYESYSERMRIMSKNKFCSYLTSFGISKTRIKEIIKVGDKNKTKAQEYIFWERYEVNNYKDRYKKTNRTKKVDQLTNKQTKYLIELRNNEPNKGYKLFENGLFIPENKDKYEKVFSSDFVVSKRLFYDVINKYKLPHRITKTKKIGLLSEHKKNNTLETYLAKMHNIYMGYKSLHKWQVDIKYLTDIPNYVTLGIMDIYLYEITFRDYKSGTTICFFGDDRSKSSVILAFEMFKKLMNNIGMNLKDIKFQFDGGAEFSNIRINDVKGVLIEMIERDFKGYALIKRKEQNGHVETFHRRIEENLFDTKYISNLKVKLDKGKITKQDLKKEILKLLNKYILNFNNYWYSSYKPRYEVFGKKSPLTIVKEDWKNEIHKGNINIEFLEKYSGGYDVSRCYNLTRIHDYPNIVNSAILLNENKFDLAYENIKLLNDNYLDQFYDFLDLKESGPIGNGTIEGKKQKNLQNDIYIYIIMLVTIVLQKNKGRSLMGFFEKIGKLFVLPAIFLFSSNSFAYSMGDFHMAYSFYANSMNYSQNLWQVKTGERYSCGPTSLLYIFNHYYIEKFGRSHSLFSTDSGVKSLLKYVYDDLNTHYGIEYNSSGGTSTDQLKYIVKKEWKWNTSVKANGGNTDKVNFTDMAKRLGQGYPVIIALEAGWKGNPVDNFGHIVIVFAADATKGKEKFWYIDPYYGGVHSLLLVDVPEAVQGHLPFLRIAP